MENFRNQYRPELHYMRGPGPKWLEKHAGSPELAPVVNEHREIAYATWLIPALTVVLLGFAAVVALA